LKIHEKYFLNPKTSLSFGKKHPWIFNGQIEKKNRFKNGDFIQIVSGENEKKEGVGIYSSEGLIAIRIIYFGRDFTLKEVHRMVEEAILKDCLYCKLQIVLDGFMGNDLFPGITIDMHGTTLVVMAYSDSLIKYARYVSMVLFSHLFNEKSTYCKAGKYSFKISKKNRHGTWR